MKKTTLILAGGKGTRMGKMARYLSKCLLPINGKPLLQHLLDYLTQAKLNRVIISTQKEFKFSIQEVLTFTSPNLEITLIENEGHHISVLDALKKVPAIVSITEPFLILLSDIFYLKNPFLNIPFESCKDALFGMRPIKEFDSVAQPQGIIRTNEHSEILSITKTPQSTAQKELRWSGMALCGNGFWTDFDEFAITSKNLQAFNLEDFFQFRIIKGRKLYAQENPPFININTPTELNFASLAMRKIL